jgi:hypothetical protein
VYDGRNRAVEARSLLSHRVRGLPETGQLYFKALTDERPTRESKVELIDQLNFYSGVATYLLLDLVAIFLMTYVLNFRRHWRADLLLSYVALNIGIFVAMSLLTQVRVDIAVGFGLFAILSIIRLRSSAVTQQEVAYYFVALLRPERERKVLCRNSF